MSAESYSDFLKALGHTVVQDASAYWYDAAPRFLMSFPFDKVIDSEEVRHSSILQQHAVAARFLCREGQGHPSWTIVCEQSNYDLANLSSNTRSKIRRGLKNFDVRPITLDELRKAGHRLNQDTLRRQGRRVEQGQDHRWRIYLDALANARDADIWGAVAGDELAAYCVAFRMDSVAHLLLLRSSEQALNQYANNALIFGYLRYALQEAKLKTVSFGWEPMGRELSSLVQFKESMGFVRKPARQAVVLRDFASVAVHSPAGAAVQRMARLLSANDKAMKLAGLIGWVRAQPPITFAKGPSS